MGDAAHLGQLEAILQEATRLPTKARDSGGVLAPRGEAYLPHVSAEFPGDQVRALALVSLWFDGAMVCLAMWPGELKAQYECLYSSPTRVEALVALNNQPDWQLDANFHLAYWLAAPARRWYPQRRLTGPDYIHQWVQDCRRGRAGRRPVEEIDAPSFRQWLIDRTYASPRELLSLDAWRDKLPRDHFDIRPGAQMMKTWQRTYAFAPERKGEFAVEVRHAIDQVLSALDEPKLSALRSPIQSKERLRPATRHRAGTSTAPVVAPEIRACASCYMVHAGECL